MYNHMPSRPQSIISFQELIFGIVQPENPISRKYVIEVGYSIDDLEQMHSCIHCHNNSEKLIQNGFYG